MNAEVNTKKDEDALSKVPSGEEFWKNFDLERFFEETDKVGEDMREEETETERYDR